MSLTMSISPTRGIAPTHPKPALGNIPACSEYAHQAVKVSNSKPSETLAYIWARFLITSFLEEVTL